MAVRLPGQRTAMPTWALTAGRLSLYLAFAGAFLFAAIASMITWIGLFLVISAADQSHNLGQVPLAALIIGSTAGATGSLAAGLAAAWRRRWWLAWALVAASLLCSFGPLPIMRFMPPW